MEHSKLFRVTLNAIRNRMCEDTDSTNYYFVYLLVTFQTVFLISKNM